MTKSLTPAQALNNTLEQMKPQLKRALPSHISPEKFIRVAQTAILTNPSLVKADRQSLLAACTKAAQDGLLPDGKEAALVPYGNTVNYMAMIGGICKKARNSGEIASIDAVVVYENDEFEYWVDEKGPHFKHKMAFTNRGEVKLTYAYAVTKDDSFYFEIVPEDEMKAIEGASKGKNTPWKGPFKNEMRRKSALRRLAKYRLPSSTDLDHTLAPTEEEAYDFSEPQTQSETAPKRDVEAPSKLKDLMPQEESKEVIDVTPDETEKTEEKMEVPI